MFKKHASVQGEFGRLVKDDSRIAAELRGFLPDAYNLKSIADYGTGPGSQVSAESANDAVQKARRFVECVTLLIRPS